ncbi:Gfo/Idh/MocA family oxidoreductase [Rubrivirga sp. S365]|uniref:Gfo/Idh/MocA family oxidoreductase n=1 Tax=Rubrivirga litoralis TaxID=3075598 RepID=A0ABU3BR85_9BACT|nr:MULTISPECIES: Gfo/Idh/MocA family oxidoreductase [unclassified Rubrivirga]MDT0631802.1 Gfo/Idh/MocA family oxidoreductase [Rubrivirga sp. F394]MDT7856506.1 Gfo/Idh/MocA family oxidoreductase [Rubrivirga sp. S365]
MSSFAFSEAVRIGHVGVGRWGLNLLRNTAALPGAEVVAVCDRRDPALAAAARLAPGARAVRDVDALLADAAVEAVVVAVETPLHYEVALAALEAGKHVFVEKPLAQTAAEAERLVREARERGLRLMVGHLLRYHPAFRHVERLAADGALGEIRYVHSMRVNLGVVRDRENAFDSLAPHDLAVAQALLPGRPVAVAAQGQAFLQPGVEDVVFATVTYEGGQIAHLHCSWLDPHKVRRTTVVGSEKMATVDDMEPAEKVRVYDKGIDPSAEAGYASFAGALTVRSGDIVVPRIAPAEPLRLEVEEFVASVREGRPALTDGDDGLAVVRVLEAARRSLAEGGARVEIP